jgi:type I restriction enzyme S subunit
MNTAEFKDSPLGPIPQDWEVKTIAEFGQVVTGSTPPRGDKDNWNGDFPWISAQDFGGKYIRESVENISEKGKKFCRLLPADSVLVTCIASIGLNAIVKIECATNQQINAVICEKGSPDFLYYTMEFNKARFLTLAGQTAVPIINKGQFETFTVPYPPLEEQQRIAEALGEVDKLIKSLDEQIEKKRLIAQGLAHDLLGMRDGKNEPIRRLPGFKGKWERKRLDDIGRILKGSGICRAESNTGNIPAIRYGEIYTHHNNIVKQYVSFISEKVAQGATRLKVGDIVFAGSGETVEEIGKSVAILDDGVYAGGDTIVFSPKMEVAPIFWGYLLNEPYVQKQKSLKGQGATIVHIRPSDIAAIEICFPEFAEQQAIAELLAAADSEITGLEAKKRKYEQIKSGMMRDLLTGKVRMKGELTKKEACA